MKDKLILLDENRLIELIEQNPFFKNIIDNWLEGNITKENIIKSGITETLWLYDGDLVVNGEFHSVQDLPEGINQLFINGNILVENLYMANMEILAVSGSIQVKSAIFQNVILFVEQNLEATKGVFVGDTYCYTEVRGKLHTPRIVFVSDGQFNVANISKDTEGVIGYNSYSERGDEQSLRGMGLNKIVSIDDFPEFKESGNSFGAFNLMVK
ncbi:hypothetical protein [Dysgonomonas sp. 25]|uniref:hypothetical protein n=1 Tax=Dysgonomonas sp. 25 TaxID=2302933 RepID=UPI0013D551B4|nr:hypothetical protein [Dysgonomonas sp. 25]NDV68241.1 hypothetical protein [Dysgonomonas sp. 25]